MVAVLYGIYTCLVITGRHKSDVCSETDWVKLCHILLPEKNFATTKKLALQEGKKSHLFHNRVNFGVQFFKINVSVSCPTHTPYPTSNTYFRLDDAKSLAQ